MFYCVVSAIHRDDATSPDTSRRRYIRDTSRRHKVTHIAPSLAPVACNTHLTPLRTTTAVSSPRHLATSKSTPFQIPSYWPWDEGRMFYQIASPYVLLAFRPVSATLAAPVAAVLRIRRRPRVAFCRRRVNAVTTDEDE